jgi:monoterpene epsilon-lactone hydrolase
MQSRIRHALRHDNTLKGAAAFPRLPLRRGDPKMASLIAQATALAVRVLRVGGQFADERALAEHIKHHRVGPARPSTAMRRRFDISSDTRNGCEVYTVAPRAERSAGQVAGHVGGQVGAHVMYIHGGAFVEGIFSWHWYFIARMVERLRMTFTVPLYPLAPEHDCAAASAAVLAVYRDLIARCGASQLVVMGDSAGGGLAMSLIMQAIAAELARPAALVLLSPWLDVTMTDLTQTEIEKVDPLLVRPGPKAAGRWYAGAMSTADPRVSPLYGEIAGLPPILMFCGTHDILVADARRLAARAAAEGPEVEYHEEAGLMHVYPLLFFPESRKAQDRIVGFVRDAVGTSASASASRRRHDESAH